MTIEIDATKQYYQTIRALTFYSEDEIIPFKWKLLRGSSLGTVYYTVQDGWNVLALLMTTQLKVWFRQV